MLNKMGMFFLLCSPATSFCADEQLSYNYAGISYGFIDADNSDVKLQGFGANVSTRIDEHFFLSGGFFRMKSDDLGVPSFRGTVKQESFSVGPGFRMAISERADFNIRAALLKVEYSYTGDLSFVDGDSDTGYSAGVGARYLVGRATEAYGNVSWTRIFDDINTAYGIGVTQRVDPIYAGVSYSMSEHSNALVLGLGYNF